MYQTIKHTILIVTVLLSFKSNAQKGDWRITLSLADSLVSIGSYYTAIDYYKNVIEEGHTNNYVVYNLAHAYLLSRDYVNAEEQFKHVMEIGSGQFPQAKYYYAQCLKNNKEYLEAYDEFENIKNNYKGPNESKYRKWARLEMEACIKAEELLENPQKVKVQRLDNSINTNNAEMSAHFVAPNKMIYTSIQTDGINTSNFMKYAALYEAERVNSKSEWKFKKPFIDIEAEMGEHLAHYYPSPTGTSIYFTKCKQTEELKMECSIFKSAYNQETKGWGEPIKLGNRVNIKNYISTHPTIGIINDTIEVLYFTSNRPGGFGGFDIWFSIFRKGEFSNPVNVGKKINSNHDEFSPYYDTKNAQLYFSSKGHINYGGYDIFKSTGEGKKWTTAENLEFPINSSYDDIYFTIRNNEGFFASNRDESLSPSHPNCCDDIYYYQIEDTNVVMSEIEIYLEDNPKELYTGEAELTFYKMDQKDRTQIQIEKTKINDGKFNFKAKTKTYYKVKGFNSLIRKFYTGSAQFDTYKSKSGEKIVQKLYLKEMILNRPYPLKVSYSNKNDSKLDDFDKSHLKPLIRFMKENPDIIIEIGSHSGGSTNATKITEQRSKAIKDHLVEKGITPTSIITKGYGNVRPVAPNKNKDGSINEEGIRLNDRVEYKIIGGTVQ